MVAKGTKYYSGLKLLVLCCRLKKKTGKIDQVVRPFSNVVLLPCRTQFINKYINTLKNIQKFAKPFLYFYALFSATAVVFD